MIAIGAFQFPERNTVLQVNLIEAKSKVRKEIQIQSLVQSESKTAHKDDLSKLQSAVEAFDRQQTALSLSRGRYYQGRRRFFRVISSPTYPISWVTLHVFTHDRFERSLTMHEIDFDMFQGNAFCSVINQGNWDAPPSLSVTLSDPIASMQIECGDEIHTFHIQAAALETVEINSEERSIKVDGVRAGLSSTQTFPMLKPGVNTIRITVTPDIIAAACQIQFRDIWV